MSCLPAGARRRAGLCFAALLLAGVAAGRAADSPPDVPLLSLDPGGHTAIVNKVLFTPGGRELLSVGDDKVIRVTDVATGETLRTLRGQIGPGPEGMLNAAALSPDGRTLAVGGYSPGAAQYITLVDFPSGAVRRLLRGHEDPISTLAFSPDGATLASGSGDTTVRLWDPVTGAVRQVLRGHLREISGVAWSPDGAGLASASYDRTVRLWDARTGKGRHVLRGHTQEVRCVAWSPDGGTVVSSGGYDRTLRLWDPATGQLRRALLKQEEPVVCLAFSPDGRRLASGTGGGNDKTRVRLWRTADWTPERDVPHTNTVFSVAFSPDGRRVAGAGGDDNEILVWNPASPVAPRRLGGQGRSVWSVAWAPDGARLAWGNTVRYTSDHDRGPLKQTFDLTAGAPGPAPAGAAWRRSVGSRAGRELAPDPTQIDTLLVREGGREVARLTTPRGEYDMVRCYSFTPGGEIVVGSAFSLALYDPQGKRQRECVGHTGLVRAVAVSPDGRYLASASNDQTVRVWPLRTTETTTAPLLSLFRSSDGEWVAWTPEGYYACSPNGERLVGWHVNRGADKAADYYLAYQFRRRLYRPDVIVRLLEAGSVAEAVRLANAERKDAPPAAAPAAELARNAPPQLTVLSPAPGSTLMQARITVRVRVTEGAGKPATDLPLGAVRLLVNGRAALGKETPAPRAVGADGSWEGEALLTPGENDVSVVAVNAAGAESRPKLVRVTYQAAPEKPALYLLAIGVTQYAQKQLGLSFPAKDAARFAAMLQGQEGKLFRKVETRLLSDGQASETAIEEGLEWLRTEVKRGDWAVVFLAGHGVSDAQGKYYFGPVGLNPGSLLSTGVAWSTFQDGLAAVPGRVLLFLDTCRGAGVGGPRRTGQDTGYQEAIRQAKESDFLVFAGCLPNEESLEHPDWGHGAFTKALTEGLEGAADLDRDGRVTFVELQLHLTTEVKRLTADRQHPTGGSRGTIRGDLELFHCR